jgi:hypothetical protein
MVYPITTLGPQPISASSNRQHMTEETSQQKLPTWPLKVLQNILYGYSCR